MERAVYEAEATIEATHWWFVGRRKLFGHIVEKLQLHRDCPVLDVGTSTGANLRLLRELGFDDVTGLDSSEDAVRFCAEKGLGTVRLGDATSMPFASDSFALVLATDIIEHIESDEAALSEIRRVLKPGGKLLVTVPTFMSLWGLQDDVSHHKRRYRLKPLLDRIRAAGFVAIDSFYFNYVLFGPIWAARQVLRLAKPSIRSENDVNTPWINAMLRAVFDLDISTAPWLKPPFGVSALVLAEKPSAVS